MRVWHRHSCLCRPVLIEGMKHRQECLCHTWPLMPYGCFGGCCWGAEFGTGFPYTIRVLTPKRL
jgi:hypothetical protein